MKDFQEVRTITSDNDRTGDSSAPADIKLEIVRDRETFQTLIPEWNSLVSRRFDDQPFYRHFWYSNYLNAFYPDAQLLTNLARNSSGDLVGIAPMVKTRRKMAGITVTEARLIAGEHSHINGLLITENDSCIWNIIIDALLSEGVDLIYLEDIPDTFPSKQFITDYCSKKRLFLECHSLRQSPYIPSTGSFEDYRRTALSKKFRELLNNRRNRLRKHGENHIETITEASNLEKTLTAMRQISAGSWQTEEGTGMFSTPDCDGFYTSLIRDALEHRYGQVHILYIESQPAAYEFHMSHRTTEYCLKVEFDQKFSKLSPGGVLDLELVIRAFESDIEFYDLLGDAGDYKMRWTSHTVPYYRYFIFGRTAAARWASTVNYRIGNVLRKSKFLRKMKRSLEK